MKVGDTFIFEEQEFSIKNIDTVSTERFPSGRVDASKFVGSHDDPENPRTIQRGRPKMFNLSDVAEILGEEFTTPEITSDVEMTESTESAWSNFRTSDETKIISTSTDW